TTHTSTLSLHDALPIWLRALLRGSALAGAALREDALRQRAARLALPARLAGLRRPGVPAHRRGDPRLCAARDDRSRRRLLLRARSEEHTSELQSRFDLV